MSDSTDPHATHGPGFHRMTAEVTTLQWAITTLVCGMHAREVSALSSRRVTVRDVEGARCRGAESCWGGRTMVLGLHRVPSALCLHRMPSPCAFAENLPQEMGVNMLTAKPKAWALNIIFLGILHGHTDDRR